MERDLASHHSRMRGRGGTNIVLRLSRTDVDLLGRLRHSIPTARNLKDLHNFMAGLRTARQQINKSADCHLKPNGLSCSYAKTELSHICEKMLKSQFCLTSG